MALKPSLGTPSNSIPTSHYYGPNGDAPPKYEGNPGRSSFGVTFAPSFAWNNKPGIGTQTWDALMQHTIHVTQMGKYYLVNSSSKAIAIPIAEWERYGPNLAANRDDLAENFAGWRKATKESHAISYGELPAFRVFIAERHEHLADPVLKKYVTNMSYIGPLNDLGRHMHQSETLRQDWNRFLASKEGQELARQKGNIDGVGHLAVQPLEGMIYGIQRANDGKLILYRGEKSYEILASEADVIAVTLEDRLKAALGEEATHIARKSSDNVRTARGMIAEEIATKTELLRFYESLASGAGSKPELQALYGKIVRHLEHDIATTEQRYKSFAEQQFGGNGLVQKLVAEAYALGLETEQEVSNYVAAKSMEASKGTEGRGKNAGSASIDSGSSEPGSSEKGQKPAPDSDGEPAAQGPEGNSAPESGESAPSSE